MNFYAIWVAALAIAAGFIALCLWLPVKLMPPVKFPNPRLDAVNERRKTFSQVFGGAAVILTFTWTILKDSESLEQARQQAANKEFLEATKVFSDSKDNSVVLRAAGIYALGRVAATRKEYHMPMRETLVAFLEVTRIARVCRPDVNPSPIPPDIQAALQVLGDREFSWDASTRWLDLHDLTLPHANFSNTKAFQKAYFRGAILFGANFVGADLRKADFTGICGADFQAYGKSWDDSIPKQPWWQYGQYNYILNFSGANLSDAKFIKADLHGATFEGADVDSTDFSGAHLSRASFKDVSHFDTAIFHTEKNGFACADEPVTIPAGSTLILPACH